MVFQELKKSLSAAVIIAAASSSLTVLEAQSPTIPPNFVNLDDFGEVPYTPGFEFGPLGPIESPLEDADTRAFSSAFWQVVDNGGTDLTPVTSFQWTAPGILDLLQSAPSVDPEAWYGGLTLFEYLYSHRLFPEDPNGPELIHDLIEANRPIALTFKHWTLYHQLATTNAIDPVAHQKHATIVLNTLEANPSAVMRGVPFFNGPVLISDRVELTQMSFWFVQDTDSLDSSSQASSQETTGPQRTIDAEKSILANITGLYKADGSAFLGFGTSGFDCDDFADAFGSYMENQVPGMQATTVRCTWKSSTGGKSRHRVTRLQTSGQYWMCDPQTGRVSGPFEIGQPMDAGPIIVDYSPTAGSVHTGQGTRDIGDRPWSEPPAWNESQDMVDHFEMTTGLSAPDFTP